MKLIHGPLFLFLLSIPALSQAVILRGVVTDESGAVVPQARVALTGPGGLAKSAVTAGDGAYMFPDLPPGEYTVLATAPRLVLLAPAKISLKDGANTLDLSLAVATEKQEVTVEDKAGPSVSTEASNNASATVINGTDLDALPDDPDDLAAALQALAGPSAGPNGGSIFIDGFSGGQLPPKESIREIRINQNPFAPEYDKLGFGRIEIFTKPGTDKFRGTAGFNISNQFWNSRNPYSAEKAPFDLDELRGDVSGPIGNRASFFLNLAREWVDNGSIVNAATLEANPLTAILVSPQHRTVVTPRVDYQLNSTNTLIFRYSFNRDDIQDAGIGNFNLISRGYHNLNQNQTLQATETAVLSATVVNETRFQYFRPATLQDANDPGAALQVLGAFNGGGAQVGHSTDTQNNYELQNYTSILRGTHTWKLGVRFRESTDRSISPRNFGGTFTFGGGPAPELDANNQPILDSNGVPVTIGIDSLERYRRTLLFQSMGLSAAQIRALGGGATQFSINAGDPSIDVNQFDAGIFAGDDWKARPNLTVSFGLRYEVQTNLNDWRNLAPRVGVAWAPGAKGRSRPKNVIRAGFGMFYDRFALGNILAARRYNGLVQQQYVVDNPGFFPAIPAISSLAGQSGSSSIQELSASLRAPYIMQSALGIERQLPFNTTAAFTYSNSHGLHVLRSEDINAPLTGSAVFPRGRTGPVFLMESAGLYNQSQWILNVNAKVNRYVSLTGSYVYNRAFSNTDGLGTIPANPYSMEGEYGPAATDIRNRVTLAGTITTKWGVRFNPLLIATSGPPFDITAGGDLYGDTLFNGRPGIATDPTRPGLVATAYGLLDPNPIPGEKLLPRNFGRGPGQFMLNLRMGRTFAFGPAREQATVAIGAGGGGGGGAGAGGGGGGGNRGNPGGVFSTPTAGPAGATAQVSRRFSFTVSMSIHNLTNHNNPGPITGVIASPLFGRANQMAGGCDRFCENANNRNLELQTRLTF